LRADLVGDTFDLLACARGDGDARAVLSEEQRDGATDATAATGDESEFVLKFI
jgi:hypothetical protein